MHVSGSVDPVRDIEVINTELVLWPISRHGAPSAKDKNSQGQRAAATKLAKAENDLITKT